MPPRVVSVFNTGIAGSSSLVVDSGCVFSFSTGNIGINLDRHWMNFRFFNWKFRCLKKFAILTLDAFSVSRLEIKVSIC